MTFPSRGRRGDRAEEHYARAVADLLAAFRDPGEKSGIAAEDRTALIRRSMTSGHSDIRLLTFGDIAEALVNAGWRPPTR